MCVFLTLCTRLQCSFYSFLSTTSLSFYIAVYYRLSDVLYIRVYTDGSWLFSYDVEMRLFGIASQPLKYPDLPQADREAPMSRQPIRLLISQGSRRLDTTDGSNRHFYHAARGLGVLKRSMAHNLQEPYRDQPLVSPAEPGPSWTDLFVQ